MFQTRSSQPGVCAARLILYGCLETSFRGLLSTLGFNLFNRAERFIININFEK